MNGPLTINGNYSLTVIIDDVPQLRELLTQNPNGSFRVIKRKRKVNIKSNDNDPELGANVEDPIENEIVVGLGRHYDVKSIDGGNGKTLLVFNMV